MKRILQILCMLLVTIATFAQPTQYPMQRQIEKGEFVKAEYKLRKNVYKAKAKTPYWYALYILSRSSEYTNNDSAYSYLVSIKNELSTASFSQKRDLYIQGYTLPFIQTKIDELSRSELYTLNSVDACNIFIIKRASSSVPIITWATHRRNVLAYNMVVEDNTIEAYSTYLQQYPQAREAVLAKHRIEQLHQRDVVNTKYITRDTTIIAVLDTAKTLLQQLTDTTSTSVWICTGENAYRYHNTDRCRGLNRCSHEIILISIDEAESMGRTPCQICY